MTGRDQVVTATGTVQLPLYGMGEVNWTKQRFVFTIELFRDCSPVQQPDKSTFPRTFPNFPITLPIFPRTIPRLDCSTSGQEQRDIFTHLTFQRLFSVQLPSQDLGMGEEGEDDWTRAACFCVRIPSDGVGSKRIRGTLERSQL